MSHNRRSLTSRSRITALGTLFGAALLSAACGGTDGEESASSEDELIQDNVTIVTGSVPKKLRVVTAAAQCPISTDCSRSWTNKYVKTVFKDHDPDIIIMTEFFWNGTYNNMIDEVQKQRPNVYNFFRGPEDGWIHGSGGTVIASKFVMSGKQEHEYDECTLPDCMTNKGVIFARQNIGTLAGAKSPVYLDVVATHHQAKTIGDFVSVIREQMAEERDFLRQNSIWGQNGLGAGSTNSTLKIFSGDLNVSGDGPTWLGTGGHSGSVEPGKQAFGWIADNIFKPIGLRDGVSTCEAGSQNAQKCAARAFNEVERGEVIKQMYLPYAQLSRVLDKNGKFASESGVYMVPETATTFQTGSDHDAKEITYSLYLRQVKEVPEDPTVAYKALCAKSPLDPQCSRCGGLTPPSKSLQEWEVWSRPPRMVTEKASALGSGDLRSKKVAACGAPSLIQYNGVTDQSYCCPVDLGESRVLGPQERDSQCGHITNAFICEKSGVCTMRGGKCVAKSGATKGDATSSSPASGQMSAN